MTDPDGRPRPTDYLRHAKGPSRAPFGLLCPPTIAVAIEVTRRTRAAWGRLEGPPVSAEPLTAHPILRRVRSDQQGRRLYDYGGSLPGDWPLGVDILSGRAPAPAWHIVLEEGFEHDDVVLRVNGEDVYERRDVSTSPLLGYATSFETALAPGATVTVEVTTRSLGEGVVIPDSPARQLVVAINEGKLHFVTPEHARGYA